MIGSKSKPAGIEYVGAPGVSAPCKHAVLRLLQYGDQISHVKILTYSDAHGLLLTVNSGDVVAVKVGFASNYGGEAPRTLSEVLSVLDAFDADIDEIEVRQSVLQRLDAAALTAGDIAAIERAQPVRPSRWHDYIWDKHVDEKRARTLFRLFRSAIPLSIVDGRIVDLALKFRASPDECLIAAFRRLEDIVSRRTGLEKVGAELFGQAFGGEGSKLRWKELRPNEAKGRALLFTAAYTGYRNPRAHREDAGQKFDEQVREFLLVNELYHLEREAELRTE